MRAHPQTQKAAEAAALEVAALPYGEWRLESLTMLQQLEEDAAGQNNEEAFGLILFELNKDLQVRVS